MGNNASTVVDNLKNESTLCVNILHGNEENVREQLRNENKRDLYVKDRDGLTPLLLAAVIGHTGIVTLLLDTQALKIYKERESRRILIPLLCSAYVGQKDVVEVFLGFGVPQKYAEWALFVSTYAGHPGVMKCLLEHGYSIEITDSHLKQTLLHVSALGGQADIAIVLLDAGINVHVTDKNGATPLHYAAKNGHTDVVTTLLKAGAGVNVPDIERSTPLHFAAEYKHLGVAKELLKCKALVDPLDNKMRTPLYIAKRNKDERMEEMLNEAKKGQTPKKQPWYSWLVRSLFFENPIFETNPNNGSVIMAYSEAGLFHYLAGNLNGLCEKCRQMMSGRAIVVQKSAEDLYMLKDYIKQITTPPWNQSVRGAEGDHSLLQSQRGDEGDHSLLRSQSQRGAEGDHFLLRSQRGARSDQAQSDPEEFSETKPISAGRSSDRPGLRKRHCQQPGTPATELTTTAARNTGGAEEANDSHMRSTASILSRVWPVSRPDIDLGNQSQMSQLGQASPSSEHNSSQYHINRINVYNCPDNRTTSVKRPANIVVGKGGIRIVPKPTAETDESSDESNDSSGPGTDKSGDGSESEYEEASDALYL